MGITRSSWTAAAGRASIATLVLAFATALWAPSAALARVSAPADLPTVTLSSLPPEAQRTEALVRSGGPFPYAKDGSVFGNRERQLPRKERGYYREYTVKTPGSRDRGARRIICGGAEPKSPDACYYTADHYTSFHRLVQ
jgi:ribonuclease T1